MNVLFSRIVTHSVSGLVAPGFATTKTAALASTKIEPLKPFVEALAEVHFGSVDLRNSTQKQMLTREKPKERLFGYAKSYVEAETRRLATGIKVRDACVVFLRL